MTQICHLFMHKIINSTGRLAREDGDLFKIINGAVCVCVFIQWLTFKKEVLDWNEGSGVVVLRLDVAERQLRPAKRRSSDLDVYPLFVFHMGNELPLSPASLAVSAVWVCVVDMSECASEWIYACVFVCVYTCECRWTTWVTPTSAPQPINECLFKWLHL